MFNNSNKLNKKKYLKNKQLYHNKNKINLMMINQKREKLCLIKVMVLKLINIIGLKLQMKLML